MIWADVLTALKATRNYGAKVGGVIVGSAVVLALFGYAFRSVK